MQKCAACGLENSKLIFTARDPRFLCRECFEPLPAERSTTGTSFIRGAAAPPKGPTILRNGY